jgi:hypothetical protein
MLSLSENSCLTKHSCRHSLLSFKQNCVAVVGGGSGAAAVAIIYI